MTFLRHLAAQNVAAALVFAVGAAPALAGQTSPWDGDGHSAVRLIAAAGPSGAAVLRAGVQIHLAAGWKTYWRYPGDSGVPPRFNFAGSDNVKSVTIKWPAPHRFTDEGGISIGYKGDVIFPLSIIPADPGKPVVLRVHLDYAACDKLCVPASAKAELALAGRTLKDEALDAAEMRVPRRLAIGEGDALAIKSVRRETAGAAERLVVDVIAPKDAPTVDLFAEGPTAEWALPVPRPVAGAPAGIHRFAFTLDGLPPGARPDGASIRLTAVAGDQAIEVAYRIE